jgi:hypothetical protein
VIPDSLVQRRPALARLIAARTGGVKRTIDAIDSLVTESIRSVKCRVAAASQAAQEHKQDENTLRSASAAHAMLAPNSPANMAVEAQPYSSGAQAENSSSNGNSSGARVSLLSSDRRRLFSTRDDTLGAHAMAKRARGTDGSAISDEAAENIKREREPSPFAAHDSSEEGVEALIDWPKKRVKQATQQQQQPPQQMPPARAASPMASGVPSGGSVAAYSADQVRAMVASALKKQEEALREEYDAILHELLREQWENFSTFNQQYLSRQLNKSDFSYLS